ncbi:hypothetical protein BsWGS_27281 [Bradybaena similaris]
MPQTVQDRGKFSRNGGISESALEVVQAYHTVPFVQDSPRSDTSSNSRRGDGNHVLSSFSTRPLSSRKTYLLGDVNGQLLVTPSEVALADSRQEYGCFQATRRVISASSEIDPNSWGVRSTDTYVFNERYAKESLPRGTSNTIKPLDSPRISNSELSKHTTDTIDYTLSLDRKQPDISLNSRNIAARLTAHHSFHLVNSANKLTDKTVPSIYTTDDSEIRYTPAEPGHYASLPHRRVPGSTSRRATSAEPRNQSSTTDQSPIQRVLNSKRAALNPQSLPQSFPGVSTLMQVYGSGYYSNEKLVPYTNGTAGWNDNAQGSALQNSTTSKNNGVIINNNNVVINNNATLNESILNTNPRLGFVSQLPRKKDHQDADPKARETIGSVLSDKHPTGESRNANSPAYDGNAGGSARISNNLYDSYEGSHEVSRALPRSHSLTDLQAREEVPTSDRNNYSDDEDGDHFGFLRYPVSLWPSSNSAAMNKAKSPSPGNRIFPKRWRSKTNVLPSLSTPVAMWTPGPVGFCTWSSVSGRKVQLRPASILSLTEAERLALQKVALLRLQNMELGCPVTIPKEKAELTRIKKSPLSLKKRSKSVSASALDTMAKEGTAVGLVFGIPLLRCVLNDRELESRRRQIAAAIPTASPASLNATSDSSDNLLVFTRKSSSSSLGSVENGGLVVSQRLDSLTVPSYRRTPSSDSLPESECNHNTNLVDALILPTTHPAARPNSLPIDGNHLANQGVTQVPYVVKACFKHIETYGLQTLGIFRVGCSKKRVKQLREEFDCGKIVNLTDEHNPHDVGALLKEYFRDLPEPLMTNELYLPFLYAERLKDEHKRHSAISLLISMLPIANRDTLWALLRFLAVVSQHAVDVIDEKGRIVSGNKMDSHNLATLFGPNILHRTRATTDKELISESVERVEQSKEVIEVVKDMIENHHELFEISESLRDDVLRLLVKSNQETVDRILRRLASQDQVETDPESMGSVFEESSGSPILHHTSNSDADLIAFVRKHTAASHHPLRITKSADDSLDSSLSNSMDPDLSEFQTLSFVSRDNYRESPSNPAFQLEQKFNSNNNHHSPNRIPVLKMPSEQANSEVVLRSRLETGNFERPYSEGYSQCLNIPRPLYLRENSNSSTSSVASSSRNSYGGSEKTQLVQRILPTPPRSRASSPKLLSQTASPSSSSSTLIASPSNSQLNHLSSHSDSCENSLPIGSTEWEKERWKYWEKLATQKKTSEAEQETLV